MTEYVPLDGRPFRLTMGLRPLDISQWFEVDDAWEQQIAAKESLLSSNRTDVVALTPDCREASAELLDEIEGFTDRIGTRDEHPLVAASRLVADDLCIMQRSNDEWRLTGAVVCFPSRWSLASKLGASLDTIHDPVPHYARDLSSPTNQFFERLSVDRPMWRLNWTLLDNPELFQPVPMRQPVTGDPSSWWFRVERQTLVRLKQSDAIVFTIRTYVTSLPDLVAAHPETKSALLTALETASAETQAYKGWVGVAHALRPWLNG